jgi:hypothetical protein
MKNTSQKGKWGHVGAPPKNVKYPRNRFTVARAVELNEGVCELTIRKRIKSDVKAGKLVTLPVIKQAGGAVGRPKFCFQLKELVGKVTPVKLTKTPVTKVKVVSVASVTPTTPVIPTPAVTTPVVVTAPVVPTTPTV